MAHVKPSPTTWTLRLKSHKTTVVLHVDPLSTFSNIKEVLLSVLQQTSLKHAVTGATINPPTSASAIQLGRLTDPNDPDAGFVLGEWESSVADIGEDDTDAKGKGKAKASTGVPSKIVECPKGAGLKDGAVLAFRFEGDGTSWGGDDQDAEKKPDGRLDARPHMWGVVLPKFEDSYGVVNSTAGSGQEFEG
ncbi:hypothetical protein M011DRAFT_457802 [Sporormia fimetaria CBS 119925]|uniref:Uncharacterized protein n=1 Tax=Sporormia fimetaria CBS 119925 TaxID=1340428 RepID=A0A6A6VE62_9PLEO|nr:hypothetical protein M011DRAFT_457802 [Sporormia fimetaria CBS 119925]